jgi:DNA-binding transcriptional MerR regulator
MKTVTELAALAGVTVRTLHHYDQLGLLVPSARSDAGYRLYGPAELERLQEILVWRKLGFSLAEIQALVDDPHYDRLSALRDQRHLVADRIDALADTAQAIDDALAAHERGLTQPEDTMFDSLNDFDPAEYEEEARERWGHTDAYKESKRRTDAYSDDDWATIKAEADEINTDFAAAMSAGTDPASAPVRAIAERHRLHLDRWFYPVDLDMHRNLGDMYVTDPRFTATYDKTAPGLAAYVRDAIAANAAG